MAVMHVVAYDIADDGVRERVANRLLSVGYRIQRSVFQIEVGADVVEAILLDVGAIIDDDHDIVHLFRVCDSCETRRVALGQGQLHRAPTHWIV